MPKKPITIAAYLAGVTTLAVTMPAMAESRIMSASDFNDRAVDFIAGEDVDIEVQPNKGFMLGGVWADRAENES